MELERTPWLPGIISWRVTRPSIQELHWWKAIPNIFIIINVANVRGDTVGMEYIIYIHLVMTTGSIIA